MTRRAALLVTVALAGARAHSAPSEVLQRDAARVLHAKAKVIMRPGADTIAGAVEAKATLVRDLCCYEPVDAGADAAGE